MKSPRVAIFTGLSACGLLFADAPQSGLGDAQDRSSIVIPDLIRDLADENFRAREEAMKKLWEMGSAALPSLQDAASGDDPEASFRATELIRKIQLSITPETDPSILSLIERYEKAAPNIKVSLLDQLARKRAWRQILKLYATEKNPELRARFQESAKDGAVRAARECILQNDPASAQGFLELAPADAAGLLALAEFHRSQGTLDAELKRAQGLKGRNSDAWQLALQRAAGNLVAAKESAIAAGEPRIAAQMAVLMGDPLPWMRSTLANGEDDPTRNSYSAMAIRRWQGKEIRASEWESLAKLIGNRDQPGSQDALKALFLLGQTNLAEEGLLKNSPFLGFTYFESLERIPDALKALGLDPENPDYASWVAKRIDLLSADVEDEHEPSTDVDQLVTMASFLERRGLHKEADAAYTSPLLALAKKDAGAFRDFLSSLFGDQDSTSGAPHLAKRIGVAWAGDNAGSWADLVSCAFGEEDEPGAWWQWLAELDSAATLLQRFEAMLALFDIGADPQNLRAKWLAVAWAAIDKAPPADQPAMIGRIAFIATQLPGKGGNVQQSLKAWDKLPAGNRNEIFWGRHIEDLSASERWAEIIDIFVKQINRISELKQEPRPDFYAYVAGCMRKSGRANEAVKYDELADKLSLGSTEFAVKIGHAYAFSGDYERAEEWWTRAIRGGDPDSPEFSSSLPLITDMLFERGEWQQAAAISEVLAQVYALLDIELQPLLLVRQRMQADMARALANLKDDRAGAISILAKCHAMAPTEGSLADSFFPALRKAELMEEHQKWFDATWDLMAEVVRKYPQSDNTLNTAGWLASRARLKLDLAEGYLEKALSMSPEQPAYLDTMAEIQFAKGNRAKAIKWSKLAVNFEPQDRLLRRQHERFRSNPLPN